MEYAKITVKSDYTKRGDLVLRSYIRALEKIEANEFLDNDMGFIYGIVNNDGKFYEFFTGKMIDYDDYEIISFDEYRKIVFLPQYEKELLKNVIEILLFQQKKDLELNCSTPIELAKDRAIEFAAFNNHLSLINPYHRLSDSDDSYKDYDNFLKKIEEIKKMKKFDNFIIEDDEYEVLENPKRLVRK